MEESRIVILTVSEAMLGVVLEAARNHAAYLQARSDVPDDIHYAQRAGVEPFLGYRNREAASRESQEILQATRYIASLVKR